MPQQVSNPVSSESLKRIIHDGDAKELVLQAEMLGILFGEKKWKGESPVTTNQIRAIFGTVKQIEMNWPFHSDRDKQKNAERALTLLKPKVAYRVARERRPSPEFQQFAQLLINSIDFVLDDSNGIHADIRQRFIYFVDFFESILAYHKIAGGA